MEAKPNPFASPRYGRLEQVSEHCYIWRNIVNSSIFVGDDAIAVVDTQVNRGLAIRLRDELQRTFDKPIRYAINTHYHWDHTNGNRIFKDAGATLIANRATEDFMVSKAPRQKGFLASRGFELGEDPLPPDCHVEETPELDLGNLTLRLQRGTAAESHDPTLVFCENDQVLAAGDTVMTGSFPIFGQPSQSEGLQNDSWLHALDEVRGFHAQAVLPGHGPVAHAAELDTLERICRYFLDTVRTHFEQGMNLSECIDHMEATMPAWITEIPLVWGTPRYAILRVWAGLEDLGEPGWQHVKPSVIPRDHDSATRRATDCGEDVLRWIDAADAAFEGGDHGQAVSLLELACTHFPDDPRPQTALGNTLIESSKPIGSVLERGDCFIAALHAWHRAQELAPQDPAPLLAEAKYHSMMAFRNGDLPDIAEGLIDRCEPLAQAAHDEPALGQLAFLRGLCLRNRGDEAAARAAFTRAVEYDPQLMGARMALAAHSD